MKDRYSFYTSVVSLFFLLLLPHLSSAQTVIWVEDFETCGNTVNCGGASYTSTSDFMDSGGDDDYFGRVNANSLEYYLNNASSGFVTHANSSYTGQNGSFYYAAEDLDDTGGAIGTPDGLDTKEIVFSSIDISNASGLNFYGLFARGETDGCNASTYDDADYIEVFYNVDGGGEVKALCFNPDLECNIPGDITNEPLYHDPNCDGDGGEGTLLTNTFAEFSFAIPDGNSLSLRIEVSMDSGSEEIAFDYFRVEADMVSAACEAEAGTLSGTTETICAGETSTVSVSGNNTNGIYTQVFLIADAALNVTSVQTNPNLVFSSPGTYTVYSYNYLTSGTADPNPATIGGIDCMANCCDLEAGSFTITVLPNVTGTFTAPPDQCEFDGPLTGLGGGTPSGGVYSGPGVSDDGNGMTYSFDPATAGGGIHTLTYTPAGQCESAASDVVQVIPAPAEPVVSNIDVCEGQSTVITPTPTGGMAGMFFQESFETDGNGTRYDSPNDFFDPATDDDYFGRVEAATLDYFLGNTSSGFQVNTIASYTGQDGAFYYAAEDLDDTDSGSVIGNPDGLDYKDLNINNISISGYTGVMLSFKIAAHDLPCGGSEYDDADFVEVYYSIDGGPEVTALCFNPDLECNGALDVSNEPFFHDPNCDGDGGEGTQILPAFQTFMASIPAGNLVSIRIRVQMDSGDEEIAFDDIQLNGTAPAITFNYYDADPALGGTLITSGASYDPGTTPGTSPESIWVTADDGNCESDAVEVVVTVDPVSPGMFTAPADLCVNAGIQNNLGGGTPTGGIYSGPGVVDEGNGMSYTFDPAIAGVGIHTITYTPAGNCSSPASDDIEVFAAPNATFTAPADVCEDAAPILLDGGMPSGGSYAGPGVMEDPAPTFTLDGVADESAWITMATKQNANAGFGPFNDVNGIYYYPDDENGFLYLAVTGNTDSGGNDGIGIWLDFSEIAGVAPGAALGVPGGPHYTGGNGGANPNFRSDMEVDYMLAMNAGGSGPAGNMFVDVVQVPAGISEYIGGPGLSPGTPSVTNGGGALFSPGSVELNFDNSSVANSTGFEVKIPYAELGITSAGNMNAFAVITSATAFFSDVTVPGDVTTGNPGFDADFNSLSGGPYNSGAESLTGPNRDFYFDPAVAGVGTHSLSYSLTNSNGCTGIATDDIEVLPTNLTINCPGNIIESNSSGLCGRLGVFFMDPTITGNCTPLSLMQTEGFPSGSFFPIGTTTNSFEVTDAFGNTAGCSFTVTINDTEDPTITCPANITVDNDPGLCSTVVSYSVTTADNCPGQTSNQTMGLGSGASFPVGVTTESYTVTDASGNTAACSFTVTVNDTEDPTITCPGNIIESNSSGLCGRLGVFFMDPTISDNCTPPSLMQTEGFPSGSFYPIGTTTNSFEVTDASGNTASCSFTVTVNDTEDPTITCPADMTVDTDPGVCGAGVEYSVSTSDNCPGQTVMQTAGQASMTTFPTGVTTNTFVVTDAAGNTASCSFTVTINDTEDPTISCATSLTVQLDANNSYTLSTGEVVTASNDNCPGATIVLDPNMFSCDDVGMTIPVTATITDASGNTAGCTTQVTVADDDNPCCAAPVAICTNPVIVDLDATGNGAITVADVDGGSITECGFLDSYLVGQTEFSCSDVGANIVVSLFVVDQNEDEAECMTSVIVQDNIDPMITCPANITVDTDPGVCGAVVSYTVTTSDNCPNEVLSQTAGLGSGSTFSVGTLTESYTVTDASGNTASCSFTVTVNDNEDPTITCPANITVDTDPGVCGAEVSYTVTTSDNCPNEVLSQTAGLGSGSTFSVGTLTESYTVTDASGNTASCSFTVTVNDNEDPTITCPANITVDTDPGVCGAVVSYTVTTSDNCPNEVLSQTAGLGSGSTFSVGTLTESYTVTDASGNTASCSFTVTVNDNEDPTITCPANITVDNDPGLCSAVVTYSVTTSDNCPNEVLSQTMGLASGSAFPEGVTNNSYTVTDASGNTASCSFTVTVNDTEDPVAVCQMATLVLDGAGFGLLDPADIDGGSTDNCPGLSIDVAEPDFECQDVGPQTAELIVTDASGNSSSCIADVDVIASLACTPPIIKNFGGPNVQDPCTCLSDGQFAEEVVIGPANPGQQWVVASTDLLNPQTLQPYAPGTPFVEYPVSATQSMYALEGIHLDGIGYSLVASSPYWPGQNLEISNVCYYPDPVITGLEGPFCLFSEAVVLEGNAGGVELISEEFTINDEPATIFDPMELGIGCHTVEYTVDAGEAGPMDPNDPGCVASASMVVCVLETPEVVACNDTIQVSVDENCEALLTPDDFLEGSYACFDDYEVVVLDGVNEIPGSPVLSVDYLGEYLTVQVHHLVSGNFCWSTVIAEDKLPPVFDCPTAPVVINCDQEVDNIPPPLALDNCTSVQYNLINEIYVDQDICDEGIVELHRIWTATDEYANTSAECVQVVHITRPDDIDFPDDIEWECTTYDEYPNVIDAAPLTGVLFTTGSGIPDAPMGTYCNFNVSFSDQTIATCGTSFKIVRTWTVLDWCTNDVITENEAGEDNVQIIKVVDTTPPVITMSPFEVSANVAGVHPNPCNSQDFLPPAAVTDACNSWILRIFTPVGEAEYVNGADGLAGGNIPFPGLDLGTHDIVYQAEDACGNISELVVPVTVVDDYAPTAICDEITDVSLSSNGEAEVSALVFDDGSHDNCGIETYLARRMDGDCAGNFDDFDETVIFCCSDIPNNPIMVVFRVVDYFGNYNECMVEVNVEDKLPPLVTFCPAPQTITCDEYLDDLAAAVNNEDYSVLEPFGEASFYDNCVVNTDYFVSVNIDNCQSGTIIRTWTATDDAGNTPAVCNQTIFVEHHSDWVVEFPADIEEECVDSDLIFPGEPNIYYDACELIGITYEDQLFNIVPDACYKIIRTWTAINWCIYEDWGYDAFAESPESDYFLDFDNDGDSDDYTYRDGWNNTGAPGMADGFIVHQQVIKVNDNTPPSFEIPEIDGCIVEIDCDKDLTIPYPDITDPCGFEWEVNITGDLGIFTDIQGDVVVEDVVPGEYTLYYAVTDNCGNTSYQSQVVEVVDCKLPTPYCLNGLVVEIMQTQMVEVWASDLNLGSFDNCPGDLIFSFSSDTTDTSVIHECDDLGIHAVEIWVTDAAGNQDFCETILFVQDNLAHCGSPSLALGGLIATELDEGVADVMVDINGGLTSTMTDSDGMYQLDLAEGGDYSVTPSLDSNHGNGVTTYDMVLISQHILGIQLLDSPYKIIAADANNSETVSTLDLVAIQKIILQVESEFVNNTSWRFVAADYVFPNPLDPWEENFPEVISYNNMDQDQLETDFVAVKVGDVNYSAATSNIGGADNRTQEDVMSIIVEEVVLVYGTSPEVWFEGADQEILGYQFTLNFDPDKLAFEEILPAIAEEENFGLTFVEEGVITVSWHDGIPLNMAKGEKQFGIRFTALDNGNISDALYVSSAYTAAEAYPGGYDGSEAPWDVALEFVENKPSETQQVKLYQNVPNPFDRQTTIAFYLGNASKVRLSVMDVSGKEIRVLDQYYEAGYHQWEVEDLPGSGLYFYQLETEGFKESKRMILR